jgi:hypothetical protein
MYQFGVILSLAFYCQLILAKSGPFLIDKYDINKMGRNNLEKSNDGFLCDYDIDCMIIHEDLICKNVNPESNFSNVSKLCTF